MPSSYTGPQISSARAFNSGEPVSIATPDAAQPAQTQPFRQAPQAQPAHTGFTQDLGSYAAPAAPTHTGFTQNLGQAPVEPATGSFVDNIANAINTGAIQAQIGDPRTFGVSLRTRF